MMTGVQGLIGEQPPPLSLNNCGLLTDSFLSTLPPSNIPAPNGLAMMPPLRSESSGGPSGGSAVGAAAGTAGVSRGVSSVAAAGTAGVSRGVSSVAGAGTDEGGEQAVVSAVTFATDRQMSAASAAASTEAPDKGRELPQRQKGGENLPGIPPHATQDQVNSFCPGGSAARREQS